MLQPAAGQQAAGLDQLVHHRAGWRRPSCRVVDDSRLPPSRPGRTRHVRCSSRRRRRCRGWLCRCRVARKSETAPSRRRSRRAVAGRGVDEAGAGVVGDVVAGQQRHVEAVAAVEARQRVRHSTMPCPSRPLERCGQLWRPWPAARPRRPACRPRSAGRPAGPGPNEVPLHRLDLDRGRRRCLRR